MVVNVDFEHRNLFAALLERLASGEFDREQWDVIFLSHGCRFRSDAPECAPIRPNCPDGS